MSEWIKIRDRLPEVDQDCWIYLEEKEVTSGIFSGELIQEVCGKETIWSGFILNDETGAFVTVDRVKAWMPYFTPEPPKED